MSRCCVGGEPTDATAGMAKVPAASRSTDVRNAAELRPIPGGTFVMGDAFGEGYADDRERPQRAVDVASFLMDATPVSNAQFAEFVTETGHRTAAEKVGVSAVFHALHRGAVGDGVRPVPEAPWWLAVPGADWAHPHGPASDLAGLADHPVVHVSWHDAAAYAAWAGKRLPDETEWEYAARGGLDRARYPWGDELAPAGEWQCNIWQGDFPGHDTGDDGHRGTAPVRSYAPNGFGLWQMVGNVWEWCASGFTAHPSSPRVLRGGSYLCHDSYCHRYRVSARSANTAGATAGNLGFRCAGDPRVAARCGPPGPTSDEWDT